MHELGQLFTHIPNPLLKNTQMLLSQAFTIFLGYFERHLRYHIACFILFFLVPVCWQCTTETHPHLVLLSLVHHLSSIFIKVILSNQLGVEFKHLSTTDLSTREKVVVKPAVFSHVTLLHSSLPQQFALL